MLLHLQTAHRRKKKVKKWRKQPQYPRSSLHHLQNKPNPISSLSSIFSHFFQLLYSMRILFVELMWIPLRGFSFPIIFVSYCCFLVLFSGSAHGFGSMGPISASYGDFGLFCAIDASGKQAVICWDTINSLSSSSSALHYSTFLPPMAALSGGEGFMCGILANTSQALCWDSVNLSVISDLVPPEFKPNSYSHLAAGKDHVCAIQGSYFSENDSGTVDCWDILKGYNNSLSSEQSNRLYDPNASMLVFRKLVSGDGFTCGSITDGGIACWGPNTATLGLPTISGNFAGLASNLDSVCGVSVKNNEVQCWGNVDSHGHPPSGLRFVSLSAGESHFCGIREDDHGIECWGNFNSSLIPKGSGFLSIASSNFLSCGIRETDLILDCWFATISSSMDFDPPLELCSPGLCTYGPCKDSMFSFNASLLNEPDLTSLCMRKDLMICSPCGLNCSEGYFPSSSCTSDADRVCTPCSLCQNSSCWDICGFGSSPDLKKLHIAHLNQALLVIGSFAVVFILILSVWCFFPRVINVEIKKNKLRLFCVPKDEQEFDTNGDQFNPSSVVPCPGAAQVFRLSELKDATNGFKEFNELGRGSYGFVYKAVLGDGRQVAVKRANAATIIRSNSRDFESELEILCNVRHVNIVNLLGYCAEMGERLLVYEYMPHGTLYDHLHGGLRTLNWTLRFKIALQTAKGIEYLHKGITPPIIHHDIRSSKILLDSNWGARLSDFGLLTPKDRDPNAAMKMDVYRFGVVLLEILTGRKVYDEECDPPNIVEWGLRYIREGNAGLIIDQNVCLPKSFEGLVKFAEIGMMALCDEASISELVFLLEQLVKDGFGV